MNGTKRVANRIQQPKMHGKLLFVSQCLIILSAIIALLAVIRPGPIPLMLFLVVAEAFIIIGIVLYLAVTITGFLRKRGISSMRFSSGDTIFRQGDPADFVYVIAKGEVEVTREEAGEVKALARLSQGHYFGEMALLSDVPRTATVRAVTDVEVLTWSRADFTTLYAYLPDLQKSVDEIVQQRRDTPG